MSTPPDSCGGRTSPTAHVSRFRSNSRPAKPKLMLNVDRRCDRTAGAFFTAVSPDRGARTMQNPPVNHGEGNPEAAAEFNKAERDFVASDQGQRKIKEG